MIVGLGRYELLLPGCGSLKEKRSVLRRAVAVVRQKFNASVAEVDHLDLWQRATLAACVVSDTGFHARRVLSEIERHVGMQPGVDLIRASVDLLAPDE
ncbi:MAG: DUF503 domain-containing protein [Acidobacteria bacterium]|nr:DUF503 domain-containing protein [Acidobacteriota bacterium]